VGIAYPNIFFNVDVNAAPWHEGIGLIAIVLGLSPALAWAVRLPALSNLGGTRQRAYSFASANTTIVSRSAACAMLSIAIVIVSLPARPLDVAIAMPPPRLPNWLNDHPREPLPLSDVESSYFARYGGGAARARYGADILLVVSTSSPLRHLHAPDECLRGSGHEVRYVGRSLDRYPTALYRSTDSSGQTWRIAVSFVSDAGEVATSVGEVAWKWFQSPQRSWTMIERISPWVRDVEARRFGDSVFSAMDVQIANTVDDKQI
jgi:hypothetical protein